MIPVRPSAGPHVLDASRPEGELERSSAAEAPRASSIDARSHLDAPELPPEGLVPRAVKSEAPSRFGLVALAGRLERSTLGAIVGATVFASVLGAPLQAQADTRSPLPPSSATTVFDGLRVAQPLDRTRPHVDAGNMVKDPNTVVTENARLSGAADVRRIVETKEGAPKTAEVVAAKLAELYGPFTAANTEENRRAIIENLRWIADNTTGIRYDTPRAGSSDATTQAPNYTLSNRSGVCRDIHTATAAILASLMNAHEVNGKWVPGSPTGREASVQTVSFATPAEYHAYMVYRDPATGRWNALEYGKSYDLQAANAIDAFRSLPGYLSGYARYRITGWDQKPVLADRGVVSAGRAIAFFDGDPGVGKPGETSITGSEEGGKLTTFITPNLSATAALGPNEAGNALEGGVKLDYHEDLEAVGSKGYLRVGGGVYTTSFEASRYTGLRGEDQRIAYRTWVVGIKADTRLDGKPHELIGKHLAARYALDADLLLALPMSSDGDRPGVIWGAVPDFSKANVGAEGVLFGREEISPSLALDWALRARYQADAVAAANELATSSFTSWRALGPDAIRTDFALALTHRENGVTTRIEGGGSRWMTAPLDREISASGDHYALLTVQPDSGKVSFGVMARGESLDGRFIPVNAIGVGLTLKPTSNIELGLGADAASPTGQPKDLGQSVRILGNLKIKF